MREGLHRLVTRAGAPPAGDAPTVERARWRNQLLDEVGSDARPLVELLLRVYAHGVVAELPTGPMSPGAWAPIRARVAYAYAAETFLDAEMARWAVDAWAFAFGLIDVGGVYVPPIVAPLAPPPLAVRMPATAGAFAPPTAAPVQVPGPVPGPGSVAVPGRAAAGAQPVHPARPGKLPGRVRRAIARANAPPPPNPFPQNFDRIAGFTFMGMVTAAAVVMWMGITERREAGGLEVGAEPVLAGVGMPAPAIAPLPRGAVEPAGPVEGATASPAPAKPRTHEGDALVDSLRLRDGTVRTGFVERVSPDGILLRDPWSDTTARLGFEEVVEWRTQRGERLPIGGAAAAPDATDPDAAELDAVAAAPAGPAAAGPAAPPDVPAARTGSDARPHAAVGDAGHAARVAGLAGRYAVRRQVLDVRGSGSCDAVAAAVRAAAPTVETVEHRPGEAEFALSSRPGLRGVVDDDGRFRTAVVEGERRGVRYRFRMVGQFLPDGFRAETESETRAVLRWGDVQQCHVSVALAASRLP